MQIKKIWKRVGTLAAAAMLMAPLGGSLVGGAHTSAKADVTENKVDIKLHKMETGDASSNLIENTGDELDTGTNVIYDPDKYGDVEFTLYDVSSWFDGKEDITKDEFTKIRDEKIKALSSEGNIEEAIEHQNNYLGNDGTIVKQGTYDSGETADFTNGVFNINGILNSGYYLIVETGVSGNNVNKISVPLLLKLPLANKPNGSDIHLYAKNQIQTADPTVIKEGQDINEPDKWINLKDVEFKLTDSSGAQVGSNVVTDKDGKLIFESLKPGATYTLTEISNPNDGYGDTKVTVTFKVDKDGNIVDGWTANPQKSVIVNGSTITIRNFLNLGSKTFQKTDESGQDLAGAEFIVQHPTDDSKYAQFDKDYKFVKWGSEANATDIIANSSGQFTISGLPFDDGYRLIETKSPDGYSKLGEAKTFNINSKSGTTSERKIENKKYDLPITGGMGLLLFILAGLALMGTSVYLYRRNKRQANK